MADLRDLHNAFARLEELIPDQPLETLGQDTVRQRPGRGRAGRRGWANPIVWGAVVAAVVVAATVVGQHEWHDHQRTGAAPTISTAPTPGPATRPSVPSSTPPAGPTSSAAGTRTRASSSVPSSPPPSTTTGTPSSTRTPPALTYRTYGGAKFRYSLQVPTDYIAVDPGHDDPTFLRSPDHRVKVTPYSTFNGGVPALGTCLPAAVTPGDTPSQWLAVLSKVYTDGGSGNGAVVTYASVQGPVVIVSGLQNGQVYYERSVVYSHVIYGVVWTYPAALKQDVDPAVQESARTFRPGPDCLG